MKLEIPISIRLQNSKEILDMEVSLKPYMLNLNRVNQNINIHCDHVNDFPVVNGTPGIIQDPIDLLLAKCNFPNKRSTVLVLSTCNTVDLLKLHLLFPIFY